MTLSNTPTAGKSTRGNSLNGVLKFLSTKYSLKSNEKQIGIKISRRSLPAIRKSSSPREDRLQLVLTNNGEGHCSKNYKGIGEGKLDFSVQNNKGNKPSSLEPDIREEKFTPAVTEDNASKCGEKIILEVNKEEGTETSVLRKSITKSLHSEDLLQYEEAEKLQNEAMNRIEAARQKVNNDQVQQVWGLYMYGLKHVLALNDLSNAPDAILPGNF